MIHEIAYTLRLLYNQELVSKRYRRNKVVHGNSRLLIIFI